MSLPLTIRKNIRDNEPHLKENLEKIQNATGKEFEFEADWANAVGQLDEYNKNNVGSLYQQDIMSNLANNITNLCKNETSKEAFVEGTSANKIIIRVNDKLKSGYWNILFENGALVVEHKKSICNIYEVQNFDIVAIIPTPGLPLVTRLNLEKNKEKLEEHLEKINQYTGQSDWTVDVDFEKVLPQLDEYTRKTIGDTYYDSVMDGLARNLERTLKVETTKESFNEATSQHRITISVNDKQPSYWMVKFNNGSIEISHKKSICNIYEIQNFNLEEVIPSPGLPLVARLNIEKNRENLEENLEKLNNATGQSDWTVEVDFDAIYPTLEQYTQKTIGDLYHKDVLENIVRAIENACKNETVKEAFNEATSQHKIIMKGVVDGKGVNQYWTVKFENGAIVISHKKSICNIYELANVNLPALIPTPGLPLETRLNIQQYQEKLQEHLDTIKEATGEEYTVDDACVENIFKAVDDYQKKSIGSTFYDEVMRNLANNIKNRMADDMVKEAFNEVATAHQITFRPDAKLSSYWAIKFENGAVVVSFRPNICNIYELQNFDIEKLL